MDFKMNFKNGFSIQALFFKFINISFVIPFVEILFTDICDFIDP